MTMVVGREETQDEEEDEGEDKDKDEALTIHEEDCSTEEVDERYKIE